MQERAGGGARLGVAQKLALGSGDHAITLTLSCVSFVYFVFLTDVVGLRPALAGAVLWIGRIFDAFTDPLMGRISDTTRTRLGRRRPYFLLGALPHGLSFALLWFAPALDSQTARFAYCVATYMLYDLTSTLLSVPYVAILPEAAPGYVERNAVNAYRSALALGATLLAGGAFVPLAHALGGEQPDYFAAGVLVAAWVTWPWLWLFAAVPERPGAARAPVASVDTARRALLRHPDYLWLTGLYVCGRIAMDIAGMMLLLYFTHWLGRPGDFPPTMAVFIGTAAACLPFWVRVARTHDKRRIFQCGCAWWAGFMVLIAAVTPRFPPRELTFVLVALAAIGYAVIEMMPWSMLGEVVDEDELRCGERREGVYGGVLTWTRKLAGATAVALVGLVLDAAGYRGEAEVQPESARSAIRWLTTLGPALFLGLAIALAGRYSLTPERHARIRSALDARAPHA